MAKKQQVQDKRYELFHRAHTKEYYAVAQWLSEVKFTPAVVGVDEADVWRKIEKLCELYEDALSAERARNAKLERKLRSGKTAASEPVVQKESANLIVEETVQSPDRMEADEADVSAHVQMKSSEPSDEDILKDLLREFGPKKGGRSNG